MRGRGPDRRRHVALLCALVLTAAACSSGDDTDGAGGAGGQSEPAVTDVVAAVASFDLAVGPPARLLVGLQTNDRRFVAYGTATFRFTYLGTKESSQEPAYGQPVTARFMPVPGTTVPVPPPDRPRLVTPAEARGVYAADAGFDRAGFWQVEVAVDVDGKERKGTAAFAVNEHRLVPGPGDQALATENLTLASADAPKPAVDSRAANGEIPDTHLHQTTIAAALAARRPVVGVFATPVYCESQFCGPVTDVVADLARTYGDRATFVHVEIWRDFQGRVINKAAAEWLLRNEELNEPWVFVIGADGTITHRFDNVATREEIEPILQRLPVIGPAA